jgi:hypothetical protein
MKKIIIGIFILCFCSGVNAFSTGDDPPDGYKYDIKTPTKKEKIAKSASKVKTVGKFIAARKAAKVVVGGGIVATGTVILGYKGYKAYKAHNPSDLSEYIYTTMSSDRRGFIIEELLNERIEKNFKDPNKNKDDIVIEAQEALRYYIIRYNGTEYANIAINVANSQGIYTPVYKKNLDKDLTAYSSLLSRLDTVRRDVERKNRKQCTQKERVEIQQSGRANDYTHIHSTVEEWDTGAYKDLRNRSDPDDREHDHIPSKAAVRQYLMIKNNNGQKFSANVVLNIENNASAVNIHEDTHAKGRTHSQKKLFLTDAMDLSGATIKDFGWHYINSNYNNNVLIALEQVYLRNYILCLYE